MNNRDRVSKVYYCPSTKCLSSVCH